MLQAKSPCCLSLGISSSIGVPASVGIPVTHRGVSESFWVITGTTSAGKLSEDVKIAAQTNATVVILMGVEKLSEIVKAFKKEGPYRLGGWSFGGLIAYEMAQQLKASGESVEKLYLLKGTALYCINLFDK